MHWFSMDKHSSLVAGLFSSWKPQHPDATLVLSAHYQPGITRRGFAEIVRNLGTLMEASLQTDRSLSPSGESSTSTSTSISPAVRYRVQVDMYDWEAKQEWWWNQLASCLPSWAQQQQLIVSLHTRE